MAFIVETGPSGMLFPPRGEAFVTASEEFDGSSPVRIVL